MMGVPKSVRNGLLSAIILLLLIVGGGVAYTKYSGTPAPSNIPPKPAAVQTKPAIAPSKPAANQPASASVTSVTSPAVRGSNVLLQVSTVATSKCSVEFIHNGVKSTDSGLMPKVADDFGSVSWTWTIDNSVPLGTWPANVTCVYNGRSAVVTANIQVQ